MLFGAVCYRGLVPSHSPIFVDELKVKKFYSIPELQRGFFEGFDVWPIENLWGILNMRVKAREPLTKEDLRRIIEEEWCKIDDDKDLCRRLMRSIPKRLQVNSKF